MEDPQWAERKVVPYYQWVSIILLVLSVLSLLPGLLWRFLSRRSGIDVSSLMSSATAGQTAGYQELRERSMRYVVNQIDRYLLTQRERRNNCWSRYVESLSRYCFLVAGKRHGNYLTVSYLFVKVLFLGTAVGQLFLLHYFLDFDFIGYGFWAVRRALRGQDWQPGQSFPRVTLCAFKVHHQSRVHDYIVQCALTINLFNEVIFLFVWFWLVFISLVTVLDLFLWSWRFVCWSSQLQFVRQRLRDFEAPAASAHRHAKTTLTKFVEYYMRRDGLLIVRLMAINVGDLAAAETLAGLWENYGPDKRQLGQQASSGSAMQPDGSIRRRRHIIDRTGSRHSQREMV